MEDTGQANPGGGFTVRDVNMHVSLADGVETLLIGPGDGPRLDLFIGKKTIPFRQHMTGRPGIIEFDSCAVLAVNSSHYLGALRSTQWAFGVRFVFRVGVFPTHFGEPIRVLGFLRLMHDGHPAPNLDVTCGISRLLLLALLTLFYYRFRALALAMTNCIAVPALELLLLSRGTSSRL
jgi:hypothetical protein